MKFKHHIHKEGNTRIRKAFLLLPKWINNETRWLETASWLQREVYNPYSINWFWNDQYWIDDTTNLTKGVCNGPK